MRVVNAVNALLSDPDGADAKLDAALADARACAADVRARLQRRPSVAAARARAAGVEPALAELVAHARVVQESGRATLASVQAATREITVLDRTKENLTASVRMLRQLRMLSRLYVQLDALLKERRYEDMAGTVEAASDLIEYFRPFRPLPQVSKLSQEIGDMEIKIYEQVRADFARALATAPLKPEDAPPSSALVAACEVLDSLDQAGARSSSRAQLVAWYCDSLLAEYRRIFAPEDEAGALENVQPRFTYLKNRVIKQFLNTDAKFFPPEWPVEHALVSAACATTADALAAQIPRLSSADAGDMELLLGVLQEAKDFERYAHCGPLVSAKLQPYLGMWVEFQEAQLARRVGGYAQARALPERGDAVLASSKELVNFDRVLLAQLAKFEPPPELVRRVVDALAATFGRYAAQVLLPTLPASIAGAHELFVAGVVNATCDYAIATVHQLERTLAAQYFEGDADAVSDVFEKRALVRFRHVALRAEDLFVAHVARNLEPHYVELGQRYSAQKGAGGEVASVSPFTPRLVDAINELVDSLLAALQASSVAFAVAARATEAVCTGFLTTVMARVPKPLHESLVQQMLLDFGAVRQDALLRVPDKVPREGAAAALRVERLQKRVMDLVGQTEAVLKVLLGSTDSMDTFIQNYQLLIKDRSTLNFRKVLEAKGVRFQSRAIEKFKALAAQDPQLLPESYLLSQIPTTPPQPSAADLTPTSPGAFGINNFKKIGEFLRRE